MNWLRQSFGAKLLAALVGTVGLLLAITLLVVRSQTNREVRLVEDRTVRSAAELFDQLNELQRQQADQLARPFTEGMRTLALLDEAIRSRDLEYLQGEVEYELLRSGLGDSGDALVALTDDEAQPVIFMIGGATVDGDPADIGILADTLLRSDSLTWSDYRVIDDRLYYVQAHYIELARRPIGTITFGFPLRSEDIDDIAGIGGFEVCLLVDSGCVVRSAGVGPTMEGAMASAPAAGMGYRTELEGAEWSIQYEPLSASSVSSGQRIVAVTLDDVREPFENIQLSLLLAGAAALLLCGAAGVGLSRSLTRPVRDLVTATGRVAQGDYETEVAVQSSDEIGTLADAFNEMTRGLLMREQYRSVLNKVVSQDVAEELMKGDVELGGENRMVSVLFADIRGFTPMTQGMEPQEVIGLINDCMERLSRAVDEEGGVVDKFIGDEIMAVFGAPVAQDDHACRSVRAALRMRAGIAEMNAERERRGDAPLAVGIGIASGVAVAGNMGSVDRMNYTVLGETVNLAARLTAQAAGGDILISEATEASTADELVASCEGTRTLKGFSGDSMVWSVEAWQGLAL